MGEQLGEVIDCLGLQDRVHDLRVKGWRLRGLVRCAPVRVRDRCLPPLSRLTLMRVSLGILTFLLFTGAHSAIVVFCGEVEQGV